jgi:hypothetical protein
MIYQDHNCEHIDNLKIAESSEQSSSELDEIIKTFLYIKKSIRSINEKLVGIESKLSSQTAANITICGDLEYVKDVSVKNGNKLNELGDRHSGNAEHLKSSIEHLDYIMRKNREENKTDKKVLFDAIKKLEKNNNIRVLNSEEDHPVRYWTQQPHQQPQPHEHHPRQNSYEKNYNSHIRFSKQHKKHFQYRDYKFNRDDPGYTIEDINVRYS